MTQQRISRAELEAELEALRGQLRSAEHALERSEESFRLISGLTSDLAYAYEVGPGNQLEVEWIGGALGQLTGYSEEEANTPEGWENLILEEDRPIARGQLDTLNSGGASTVDYRIRTNAGKVLWVRDRARPVCDADGAVIRVYGAIQDITERRAALQAQQESEEKYRALVENTKDTIYSATPEGQLTYLGQQFARYGFDLEQVMREGVFSAIIPEDHERVMADLQRTMETGAEFPTEFRVRTPEGQIVWLEDHGKRLTDEHGQVTGLSGVLRDITDRKEAEAAASKSEARFRRLADRSFDTVFEIDGEGRIVYISPSVERISGRTPEAYLNQPFNQFMLSSQKDIATDAFGALSRGQMLEGFQLETEDAEGAPHTLEFNIAPLIVDGEVQGFHGAMRDISARLALEEQVRQMQKMEAIGTLAGGVAHDFNNLLTGILGYANLLKGGSAPDQEVFKAAAVIESAAERAAELTQQLLGFARRGKLQNCPVDLHRLVGEVVALLSRTTDRRVVLTQRLRADPPLVLGDPGQLQQVLLNLAVNAGDAMPDGGELSITTDVEHIDEAHSRSQPGLAPGHYLVLTVQDTGAGMTDVVRQRIFEPFFTTKERGQGTGMGLATAYGIVQNHEGVLRVESTPGNGATFRVYLPQDPDLAAPSPRNSCAAGPGGSGRVLVVDDEEIVHRVARGMLEPLGYQVDGVYNGKEAVDFYRDHPGQVDVILLDLTMPVMDGRDCFHALRALDPAVRAVLSTGHGLDGAAQRLLDEGVAGFIQKPYVQAQLAAAILEALTD
jgi:two-component system cell cycle sensor histidine kinase/response regulator CckA